MICKIEVFYDLLFPFLNKKEAKARAPKPVWTLVPRGTGHHTRFTYGHKVRAIKASRGGREGNNALIADNNVDHRGEFYNNAFLLNDTHIPHPCRAIACAN